MEPEEKVGTNARAMQASGRAPEGSFYSDEFAINKTLAFTLTD